MSPQWAALEARALRSRCRLYIPKRHRFTDRPGDPHSPHTEHGIGFTGALRGLFHAHVGWMFRGIDRADPKRYAEDLVDGPIIRAINRTFPLWVIAGLLIP